MGESGICDFFGKFITGTFGRKGRNADWGQRQCCRLNGKAAAMELDWAASHAGMLWQQQILTSVQFGNDVGDGMW